MKPSFVFAAVPDSIFGPEHPPTSLAVEHGKIAHRNSESARLQIADAPFLDEKLVPNLSFGEWVDGH